MSTVYVQAVRYMPCIKFTSKKPFLLTHDSEKSTMVTKMISKHTPVTPAVPYTQPKPVFGKKKYSHKGRPSGFTEMRTARDET